jgi:hypothetical protein
MDQEPGRTAMSMWQINIAFVLAGCAVGCLLAIFVAVERLSKRIFSVGVELAKMNAKLEKVEAVNKDETKKSADPYESELEAIEMAISNFEKLKRVDLTKIQEDKA